MTRIIGAGGGGGGGGCFLGHTLVGTPEGLRAIETLKPGDLVLSFDDQGALHQAKVLKVHEHENERVVRYRLWGGTVLDATPNHWVLNQFNAFVEIDTLGPDDCLVDENGHLRPIVERTEHGRGTVYNLTVEGHHTFIAGGVRVHNAGLGLGAITGAGGGGGGGGGKGGGGGSQQYNPTVVGDSLDSKQYAKVLDLISEGEIQGLKDGHKSIFINNTPLQNADGTYNFQNVTIETRTGTQNQTYIPITADIEDEKPVNVTVNQSTPIVRSLTDSNINAARITITVPQLQEITNKGDQLGASLSLAISVQYNNGGYTEVITDTISGRSSDPYQKSYLVNINGAFPVDIKVTRTSADSSSGLIANSFNWSSYTEIIYTKLKYPNSALVALRVDAEQFNSIPSRSYLVRGIKVRIPSNATVDSATGRLVYSGIWNGSFGAAAWTSDPAWIMWDLLTSSRYGFGDHIKAEQLDKWAFYSASVYASALVPDGFGGQEPRFSCNVNIQTQEEAFKLINDLSSVFRAMPYWATGSLTITQDKPADSAYLFTLANVTEEGFNYQSSSRKTRPNVAVVSYLDLTSRDVAYEVVEDAESISKYGVLKDEISAFACTSRGQAHRLGEWLLYTDRYESEVVSFTASLESLMVRPGQIIEIMDPVRSVQRRGGRIITATTTTVTVDDAANLPTSNATLSVILPNGTVETRNITNRVGVVLYINAATPFSVAPNANSIWIVGTNDIQTSTWRVISVSEQEQAKYTITALAYNAGKYDYVERDIRLENRDITNLNTNPDAPTNLTAEELLYEDNGLVKSKIIASWTPVLGVSRYQISWRRQNGNWTTTQQTRSDFDILDTSPGLYEVQVASISAGGLPSVSPAALSFTAFGKTAVPGNVQNLSFEAISPNSGRLRWSPTVDLDVRVGGKVIIRHSNRTDGTGTWSNSIDLIEAKNGNQTEAIVPLVEGEILVKFEDDGGRQSAAETSVIVDLPDALGNLLIQSRREDADTPPFQGQRTTCFYSDEWDALTIDGTVLFDTVPDLDVVGSVDVLGPIASQGIYDFANTLDLGTPYALDLSRYFITRAYFPGDLLDARLGEVDDYADWDGQIAAAVNAALELRRTDDDPSATPSWSAWQPFVAGAYSGRAFQFRALLESNDVDQNILIDECGYEATFQSRTEQSVGVLTSNTGATDITFPNRFFTGTSVLGGVNSSLPSVGITAMNMASGDYFELTNVSGTGFRVTFKNSSGANIQRQFSWTANGFGRGT
jgi:predicted phage tail protein